jgi:hypothetical protein
VTLAAFKHLKTSEGISDDINGFDFDIEMYQHLKDLWSQ